jgi:transcription elongation factor GreA
MDKEPITFQGLENIKKELEDLKNIKRPKIIAAIAEARAHGDLKENAEYHAAKEEQSKIEGRVLEINDVIARANVIDVTKLEKKDNVIFGSTVQLINLENNEKKTYKIVGKDEANITKNFIYFRSPIGKALIGKKKKDLVTVNAPSGEKNFEIKEVDYI